MNDVINPEFSQVTIDNDVYYQVVFEVRKNSNISSGSVININSIDYKIISMCFFSFKEKIIATGISVQCVDKILNKMPIVRTTNGFISMLEPINDYDKDVDNILKDIFKNE